MAKILAKTYDELIEMGYDDINFHNLFRQINLYIKNKLPKENEVSKVIKPAYRIKKGDLTANKIVDSSREGIINLLNSDNEISSDLIDDISDIINEVYTSLFLINEKDSDS